jgi:hypothetical protein
MKQSRRQAIKAERNYRMKTELGRKGWRHEGKGEEVKEREKTRNTLQCDAATVPVKRRDHSGAGRLQKNKMILHRLYQGHVTQLQGTRVNSFDARKRSTAFPNLRRTVPDHADAQECFVQISYAEFHPNRNINVKSTGWYSLAH